MKKLFLVSLMMTTNLIAQDLTTTREITFPAGEIKTVLQDSFGRSLYTFDVDSEGKSNCNSRCAEVWPPYTLTKEEANELKAPFGQTSRNTATVQLTYQGKPVYTYFEDRTTGDFLGNGIGGVWHSIVIQK